MSRARVMPLLDGSLGFFWPQSSHQVAINEQAARPGFIRYRDRGLNVKLLVEDVPEALQRSYGGNSAPNGFVGICEDTGAIVMDIVASGGGRLNIKGHRASTEGFGAQTVIATNEALDVQQLLMGEATIRLVGSELFDWAHQEVYDSTIHTDPATKRVQSATLELHPTTPETASLAGVGDVILEADWSLGTRTETVVSVDLALGVTVRPRRPLTSFEVLRRLGALQLLVSSVFDGFVVADGGWARVPGVANKGALWNSILMGEPAATGIKAHNRKSLPFVDLPPLGGVGALARWIRLSEQHPRVMAPIVNRWRRGQGSPELQLVECSVAIEYWVAYHRRRTKWANESRHWPLMAAKQAASEFGDLVGDIEVWADRLWSDYGALKHDPHARISTSDSAVLAESAYFLLLGLLLDRIAGSKKPSRAVFKHHRLENLGRAIRGVLGT